MIKPVGALCNLDCGYCYYLPTKEIYGGHEHRMTLRTLEEIMAGVLPLFTDDVTIAWQGGEPILAGLNFFEKAIELQEKYRRPGQQVHHALQTNGTLLDDDWCKFLRNNNFLIGLSVDGPSRFHDHYRFTNRGEGSHKQVMKGLKLLQQHAVEYNILCVLNDFNVEHPDEVLSYLLNLGSRWLQFIPAVEWIKDPQDPTRNRPAPFSPTPEAYGRFLCRVFDLWFGRYRKRLSIRIFDAILNKLVLGAMPFCILDGSCHTQMTIEHDGSVFGCDHFVERRWQLAHIGDLDWQNTINLDGSQHVGLTVHGQGFQKFDSHVGRDIHRAQDMARFDKTDRDVDAGQLLDDGWLQRVDGARLGTFAARKQNLPEKCKSCQWKPYCHGGCPKHRPHGGDVPEPTYLCEAYMMFYEHAMPQLQWLAGFLRQNREPPDPQPARRRSSRVKTARVARPDSGQHLRSSRSKIGRNDPCPCGSGLKYKRCHGNAIGAQSQRLHSGSMSHDK